MERKSHGTSTIDPSTHTCVQDEILTEPATEKQLYTHSLDWPRRASESCTVFLDFHARAVKFPLHLVAQSVARRTCCARRRRKLVVRLGGARLEASDKSRGRNAIAIHAMRLRENATHLQFMQCGREDMPGETKMQSHAQRFRFGHMYMLVCIYVYVCVYICTHKCIHIYMCIHIYTSGRVSVHRDVRVGV